MRIFLLCFLMIVFLAPVSWHCQILAQTPTTSSRAALVESIQVRAQQDAKAERPRANAQDLNLLFGRDAEREMVPLREVVEIYDNAYSAAKPLESWWNSYLPKVGWVAAIIMFLLLIAQEAIKRTISTRLEAFGEKLHRRMAGYRLFQRKSLRRYSRALIEKYRFFQVTFRPNRDLDMSRIYVPLKVKGASDTEQVDDLGAINKYKRAAIIGAPGSGKSMLLKRVALLYATENLKNYSGAIVPVFFDLRRLNSVDKPLIEHLVDIFALNKFPAARNFIMNGLEQGKLLLLFDGLDEVNSVKRQTEVDKIMDLLGQYGDCGAVITCRTAVYKNDFADAVESTLEIIEFTDQQIQKFLGSWPNIPEGKSVDQLMATLRERPRIMSLARNPLLLTIIAFLYTDMEEFVLPFSRTEFYTQAVDILLQQLKGQLNHYRVAPKLMVLEQLALFNQERGARNQSDRLSLDEKTVISQINQSLPSLNLEAKDAVPLLKEIVERSGLLLEIDGGTRYQFSHLTLQEYFAASALRGEGDKLSQFYRNDPDAWRETVKLWCGLPHDSTKLIQTINELDPVTAFECLADAQKAEPSFVNTLIDSFKPKLYEINGDSEAVIRAFASVASGPSQRSQAVFNHLMKALDSAEDDLQRGIAATALSLTNKSAAVQKLAAHAASSSLILAALVRMGDLAVNALWRQAEAGDRASLSALNAIGTPKAATVFVSLLWHANEDIAVPSAFFLASLFRQSIVLEALRECQLTTRERDSEWEKWVWKPFDELPDSPIPIIAGRVAFLIEGRFDPSIPTQVSELDRRIVIPLIVSGLERTGASSPATETLFTNEEMKEVKEIFMVNRDFLSGVISADPFSIHASRLIRPSAAEPNEVMVQLFRFLDPLTRYVLSSRLNSTLLANRATIKNWISVRRPSEYDFGKSLQFGGILIILGFFSILSAVGVVISIKNSPSWFSWGNVIAIASGFLVLITWTSLLLNKGDLPFVARSFGALYYAPDDLSSGRHILSENDWPSLTENVEHIIWYFYRLCLTPLILYFGSDLMSRLLPIPYVVAVWICTFSALGLLRWEGIKREREVFNPLVGILNLSQGSITKPLHSPARVH